MKTIPTLLCLLPLYLYALDPQFFEERTWQDQQGRRITATFVSANQSEQTVTFTMANGQEYTLPISRLADNEQASLQAYWQEQNTPAPATEAPAETTPAPPKPPKPIPSKFKLKGVPMVKQKGNYCVPASATMISLYHDFKTDQDEVAELSSAASANNEGTYPSDMILAMEKLGFTCQPIPWDYQDEDDTASFIAQQVPLIQRSLVDHGPLYISFKPGVFGDDGHGCVIIGYDDRKREMFFHNPWGNKFSKDYQDIAIEGAGAVGISPPTPVPPATAAFTQKVLATLSSFTADFKEVENQLKTAGIDVSIKMCSRQDEQTDKRFAQQTARDEGRKIIELALLSHPAIIVPASQSKTIEAYHYITLPDEGGAKYKVQTLTSKGWSKVELLNLGDLTRKWTTLIAEENVFQKDLWDLPLYKLNQ